MPAAHNPEPPGEPRLRPASFNPPSTRTIAWFLCIFLSAAACISWASLPSLEAHPHLRVALFVAMGFAMLGTVFFFPKASDQTARYLILISAIVLRLILWPAPVSDDVNRYLWEGNIVAAGENPYRAPADDTRWESRRDTLWQGMNHRDRPTAYPPGIQWIMGATAAIHPSLESFKALALLGDLAALFLLFALLRQQAVPIRWAGFYAFNPVTLIAFAAEAHFDSLMLAAMLAAILTAHSNKKSAWLWLGIAIQIKIVCLILIPLFLTRKSIRSSWLILPVLIIPGLPFLTALPNWLEGVRGFAATSAFNAPLFSLLGGSGLPLETVRTICSLSFALLALAICVARWRGLGLIDSALWMLGALLVCSPIVHFWYVAWLLPLAALRPSFAWSTLTITMALYFLAWQTEATFGWWGFEYHIAAAIWIPFALAAIAQNRFALSKWKAPRHAPQALDCWDSYSQLSRSAPKQKAVSSQPAASARPKAAEEPQQSRASGGLSIIIPIIKPDATLLPLLKTLRQELGPTPEILIVAAEESTFAPPEKTITATKGRGNQIAAGIATTTAPWILIAHADATPPPGFAEHLGCAIAKHPTASLIVCGQRFDQPSIGTLLIEALNELRVVFGGVAFGDQTMLIRRSALEPAGGFPAQPLMEDVEVSMRLATQGNIIYLGREWQVSATKWGGDFTKRFLLVIRLTATYQLARLRGRKHATTVSQKMYREYYPKRTHSSKL